MQMFKFESNIQTANLFRTATDFCTSLPVTLPSKHKKIEADSPIYIAKFKIKNGICGMKRFG